MNRVNVLALIVAVVGILTAGGLLAAVSLRTSEGRFQTAESAEVRNSVEEVYNQLPMSFESNMGQAHEDVKFLSRGKGYTLFLLDKEAVFSLGRSSGEIGPEQARTDAGELALVRMRLAGSDPKGSADSEASLEGLERLPGTVNYYLGGDPTHWQENVPTYGKVKQANVYPGVDLEFYGAQGGAEFDLIVAPGAAPKSILLGFEGARRLSLDGLGNLWLETAGGNIQFQEPTFYQDIGGVKQEIPGGYAVESSTQVGFRVGPYDTSLPLVIDPLVIVYSTFLGGSLPSNNQDSAVAIAVNESGFAYIAGSTNSTDFPPAFPNQANYGGGTFDAFVSKFDPSGSVLIYSTFLGGSIDDGAHAIALGDAEGTVFVGGHTSSPNFPTHNPIRPDINGSNDGFVAGFDSSGVLIYSTFLGGSEGEAVYGVDTLEPPDPTSHAPLSSLVYVTGQTSSSDFDRKNPLQPTIAGGPDNQDAFLTVLDPSQQGLSQLVYSTFLGGSNKDGANSIVVDSLGIAH